MRCDWRGAKGISSLQTRQHRGCRRQNPHLNKADERDSRLDERLKPEAKTCSMKNIDFCRAKAMPSVASLVRAAQKAARVPAFFPVRLPTLPEAAAWASSGRLTPAAVAAAVETAMTVKRSPEPLFLYTEVGVPDRLPDTSSGVGAHTEFVDMDPGDFVRACELQDGKTVSHLVKVGRRMIRAQRVPVLPPGPEKYLYMYKVLYGPRNAVALT